MMNKHIFTKIAALSIILSLSVGSCFVEAMEGQVVEVNEKHLVWSMKIAEEVNQHFSRPYEHSPTNMLVSPEGQNVYRPNHSLAHGLRQAFLAVDIAVLLKHAGSYTLGPRGKELREWVIDKISKDQRFLEKLEFANAFQRSGRQSESSRKHNPELYTEYLQNDQKNFEEAARTHLGDLFASQEEIEIFKMAITDRFDMGENSSDLLFLSKIFYTTHQLDLRRIGAFDKKEIFETIAVQLFETKTINEDEQKLIDSLWKRSGDYLRATGDRDMEDPQRRGFQAYNMDVFCKQAKNPELLVEALYKARMPYEE